jgi:hypothetical protein
MYSVFIMDLTITAFNLGVQSYSILRTDLLRSYEFFSKKQEN